MDQDKYIHFIFQAHKGEISDADNALLEKWLSERPEHVTIQKETLQALQQLDTEKPDFKLNLDVEYGKLRSKMNLKPENDGKVVAMGNRRKWMSIAAAIVFLIGAGAIFHKLQNSSENNLYVETTAGETKSVTLEDGSIVTLNQNSSFQYPQAMRSDQRNVTLQGEAFFEVAKDSNRPFRINTDQAKVTVLGTSFNVRAYPTESSTDVAVKTGKVAFENKQGTEKTVLTKYQAASLSHETMSITTNKKDELNAMAWQTQELGFNNRSLAEVFEVLEHFFQISFEVENKALLSCSFSMSTRKVILKEIFEQMEKIHQVKITKTSSDSYKVTGGSC